MPKISVYIAMSIDGYIARKDDSLDWLDRVGGFDEDYGFRKLLDSIDALIIGRKTYDVASTVPDPYPGKRVIVLSRSLDSVKVGMELYRGDLVELASELHREGIKHVWVDGGSVISQFLSAQLVDDMTVSVIPVILGSGIPLFQEIGQEISCRLLSSQAYPSGLVQLRYEIIHTLDFKLACEEGHIHIAGYLGQELCTTAVLIPEGSALKMQRLATKASFQDKGAGSALIRFCEEYAKKHVYTTIYCNARATAIPFFLKHQYVLEDEPFDEDGIPHHKMRKNL